MIDCFKLKQLINRHELQKSWYYRFNQSIDFDLILAEPCSSVYGNIHFCIDWCPSHNFHFKIHSAFFLTYIELYQQQSCLTAHRKTERWKFKFSTNSMPISIRNWPALADQSIFVTLSIDNSSNSHRSPNYLQLPPNWMTLNSQHHKKINQQQSAETFNSSWFSRLNFPLDGFNSCGSQIEHVRVEEKMFRSITRENPAPLFCSLKCCIPSRKVNTFESETSTQ